MEIKVKSCRECPFLCEEFEQKCCNLIRLSSLDWDDEIGFDELYEQEIHPKSCPLYKSPVLIYKQ